MATDNTDAVADVTAAKALLSQSLPRLARGGNKLVLVLASLFVITEIFSMFRLAADAGFGRGVFSGMMMTLIEVAIVVVIIRVSLLHVLQNFIYRPLFDRGELQEVRLAGTRQPVREGSGFYGAYNYTSHGGMVIFETVFGPFIPTRKLGYKLQPDENIYRLAFFYADEAPVITSKGRGLVLVDSKNKMKQWLVRKQMSHEG